MLHGCIYSGMEQVHALDTRETGKDGYIEMATVRHSSEYFEMFVGMVESHRSLMERIFYVDDTVIA